MTSVFETLISNFIAICPNKAAIESCNSVATFDLRQTHILLLTAEKSLQLFGEI